MKDMTEPVCDGYCKECGPRLDTATLLALMGSWPEAGGFVWRTVDHFHVTAEGTVQGFDGFGDPIGPTLAYSIRARTPDEEIAMLRMRG